MYKIIYLLSFFISSVCVSQNVGNEFDRKKKNILNSGIKLMIEYKLVDGGNSIPILETDCIDYNPKYLFWIVENDCYIQKYSDCILNEQIKLKDCQRLMAVYNNLDIIKKDEVLPVTMKNGDYIEFVHEDVWDYNIYTQDDHFFKSIGISTWETQFSKEKKGNVNYEINQKSKIKLLIDLQIEILD